MSIIHPDQPRNGTDPVALACVELLYAVIERAENDAYGTVTGFHGQKNQGRWDEITKDAAEWLAWLRTGAESS